MNQAGAPVSGLIEKSEAADLLPPGRQVERIKSNGKGTKERKARVAVCSD